MAVQTTEEFKDGGATSYSTTIEYLQASDIKVRIGGTLQTYVASNPSSGEYTVSGTTVTLGAAAPSGTGNVHIYRETDVNTAAAVFAAGSSIRATDLNAIHDMGRFASVEHRNTIITDDIKDDAVTSAKILDLGVARTNIANDAIDGTKIADDSVDSEHYVDGSIDTQHIANANITTAKLDNDAVTTVKVADGAITSAKLASGTIATGDIADSQITTVKIAADAVTNAKIADDSIDSEHYVDGSIDTAHIADGAVTDVKLAGGALDNRYYTKTLSDARYFNISTGDTIKDGDTFPDNDTTIATTAAINDRIIDLVDDVGGFVPIANETSFPTENPDINTSGSAKGGTIVSVKAASTNLTPSGTTVTIANGRGSGLAVIITGVTATIPSGFGFLVETTSTDHTYAFHRLSPKATEVTTVAGISSNVSTVAGISANTTTVAGISSDVTTVAGIASNVTSVAGNSSNINSAVSNATNINSAVSNASNINTVAGAVTNVNNVGGSIASVNTAASNLNSIANFGDQYQVASSPPSTDGGGNALAEGDLYFDTTADELKVYNGGSWQGGVTAAGNFASTTGNTFTGSNTYQDNAKAIFGTGQDLEILHNNSNQSIIKNGNGYLRLLSDGVTINNNADNEAMIVAAPNGAVELYYDSNKKFETTSAGATVTGNITVSGNVDGRDLAADGSSLDSIEQGNIGTDVTNGNIKLEPNGTGVVEVRGAGGADGTLQLNCSQQSHGIKLKSPAHSAAASYTLTFPNSIVNNGFLQTDSSGNLSFAAVNTDLSNDSSPQLGGDLDTNSHEILLDDNHAVKFGDDVDLTVLHSGSTGVINNVTGDLHIKTTGSGDDISIISNDDVDIQVAGGEDGIKVIGDGGVELYHNNALRFQTDSNGCTVLGTRMQHMDDTKAQFGTGGDLQVYHDGSNSYLKATSGGTGDLYVFADGKTIYLRPKSGEDGIKVINDGAVEAYHNGNKKFETTSAGATVTGTCTATSFSGDGSNLSGIAAFPSGTKMLFQQTSAPTGWTKVTSGVDNKALRVVSGSVSSGGSNAFSNTFADRSITANAANATQGGNISVSNTSAGGNVSIDSASTGGTVNNHTLTSSEMPSHRHMYRGYGVGNGGLTGSLYNGGTGYDIGRAYTQYEGGGGGHSHGFTGGSHNHNGTLSGSAHNHNASFTGSAHNHSISVSNLDLAVQYLDVIIASKD